MSPQQQLPEDQLEAARAACDQALKILLPGAAAADDVIDNGMAYAVFAGGKRLRPLLLLASSRATGGRDIDCLAAAAALEMIHTYSLVHDDLPAMDNDSLRRGQPTAHVVYGDAVAILIGDALLTRAAQVLCGQVAGSGLTPPPMPAAREILSAAGSEGMIGGQARDLAAEGRNLAAEELEDLHRRKTGALIRAAMVAGGHCADAGADQLEDLARCGEATGLAFQIVDDILDVTGSTTDLGKSAGKDRQAGKSTFPALLGLEASRQRARDLTRDALASLEHFDGRADLLRQLVHRATERLS